MAAIHQKGGIHLSIDNSSLAMNDFKIKWVFPADSMLIVCFQHKA